MDQRGSQTKQRTVQLTTVCTVGQTVEEAMEQTKQCTVVSREVHTVGPVIEQAEETDRQKRRQHSGMNSVKGRENNERNIQ